MTDISLGNTQDYTVYFNVLGNTLSKKRHFKISQRSFIFCQIYSKLSEIILVLLCGAQAVVMLILFTRFLPFDPKKGA